MAYQSLDFYGIDELLTDALDSLLGHRGTLVLEGPRHPAAS